MQRHLLTLAVMHEHGRDEAGPDAGAVVLAVLGRHLVVVSGQFQFPKAYHSIHWCIFMELMN